MNEKDAFSDIMASYPKYDDAYIEQERIAFEMADVIASSRNMSEYMEHINKKNCNTRSLKNFSGLICSILKTDDSYNEIFTLNGKPICDGYSMGVEVARRALPQQTFDSRIYKQTEALVNQIRLDTSDDVEKFSMYLYEIGYNFYNFAQPTTAAEVESPHPQEPLYDAFAQGLQYEALYSQTEYDNFCAGFGIALISLQLAKKDSR